MHCAVGDTIPINYNNKRYFIDIIEAKPGDAISVIETDCNVSQASVQTCRHTRLRARCGGSACRAGLPALLAA